MTAHPNDDVQSIVWRTAQDLDALAGRIRPELADWGVAWSATVASVNCHNAWEALAPGGPADGIRWQLGAPAGDGTLAAWVGSQESDLLEALKLVLFGTSSQGPIATQAAKTAQADLLTRVARSFSVSGAWEAVDQLHGQRPAGRAWSGDVVLGFGIRGKGSSALAVKLAGRVIPTRPRPISPRRSTEPLASLTDAVADRPVHLRGHLWDTSMTLRELFSLQPGDVVLTSHPLHEPLAVVPVGSAAVANKPPIFGGQLVQQDGHMALALEPWSAATPRSFR